ncbi:MAG TPA: hypothetical protein VGD79_08455 [Thermoanaerobaculia bacterium]|jgi:hypothetical protein
MNPIKRFFLTLTLAALALPALAYHDTKTHRPMTVVATEKTVLYTNPDVMFSFGLLPPFRQGFKYHAHTGSVQSGSEIYGLSGFVAEGSVEEDSPFYNVVNHFYDPVHERPLTVGGPLGTRSWVWMTQDSSFSLKNARESLSRGLMFNEGSPAESEGERFIAISRVLLDLGHAMHHMQDMAQPQHVRNDQHLPVGFSSRYEAYTADNTANLYPMWLGAGVMYPGSTDFHTARDFWSNSAGTGIAQTVNSQFLSQGTNFRLSGGNAVTGAYAQPAPEGSNDYPAQQLFAEKGMTLNANLQAQCANPNIDCTMTMYSTTLSTRASTLSIFDQDLRATGVEVVWDPDALGFKAVSRRFFDLNRFNFDDVYSWLMPRAIAYSAGLVNHFLRGRLEVSKPLSGPYAVADQAAGTGFTKVRATVKNLTLNEELSSGTIRAIARYRVNGCYQPDLSGEWSIVNGQPVAPCDSPRSDEAHIKVSAEQPAILGVGESKEFAFTFEDPIPLDATDLTLHIYYTGTVGAEPESFALGAVDVSEPTWIAIMNATDAYELNGVFYYWQDIAANIAAAPYSAADFNHDGVWTFPPDAPLAGYPITFKVFVDGGEVANISQVPEGRFFRLAVLSDTDKVNMTSIGSGPFGSLTSSYVHHPKIVQYDGYQDLVSGTDSLRGLRQYVSIEYHNYYPRGGVAPVESLPVSRAADADKPLPVTLQQHLLAMSASNEWMRSMNVFRSVQKKAFASMWSKPTESAIRPAKAPAVPQVVVNAGVKTSSVPIAPRLK